ncbi:MAG TPA: DUF1707 domain-containing protein [Baekduia sp.]|jgi:hypothetical protein|nr:DUF1707 domain-containing protein [Baekduia sp.]
MAETPELRASDADRERAAELLRRAGGEGRLDVDELGERLQQAFAARTRAELERLVADVADDGPDRAVGAPAARLPVRRGEGGSRWVISVLSGVDRRGHWRLAPSVLSLNILGSSDLDLNEAELSDERTEVRVIAILGSAGIRVPEGLNVEVSQLALMGDNDIRLGPERPDPGGPTVHLKLFSLMGSIDVKRGPRPTREDRRAAKQARRDERRLGGGA